MNTTFSSNELEALSAFVEGRMDPEAHAATVARLAEDEDYYELMVELLRFREEESIGLEAVLPTPKSKAEDAPEAEASETIEPADDDVSKNLAEIIPFVPRRPAWSTPRVWALAATVILSVGVIWSGVTSFQPPSTEGIAQKLTRELSRTGKLTDVFQAEDPWSGPRGETPSQEEILSFRLGARVFDLEAALAAGNLELTREDVDDIGRYFCLLAWEGPAAICPNGKAMESIPTEEPALRQLAANQVKAIKIELDSGIDRDAYQAGNIIRAAWYAAKAEDQSFFSWRVRRYLKSQEVDATADFATLIKSLEAVMDDKGTLPTF